MNYNTKKNIQNRATIDSDFSNLLFANEDEATDFDN